MLLFVVLGGVYIWQVMAIPSNQASIAKYQLSLGTLQLLRLSVLVPVLAVWLIALTGYIRIDRYASLLKSSKEYLVWRNIANGLLVLALSLPLGSIIANWTSSIYHNNPSLTAPMTIVYNYISLVFLLVAIGFIYRGTWLMYNGSVVKKSAWPFGAYYFLAIVIISSLFVYLNFSNPTRQFPASADSVAAYFLPDWLLAVTILIPYNIIWYLGIRSVEHVHAYKHFVRGKIYKSSYTSLAIGLATVVLSWAAIRFFTVLVTAFSEVTLKYLLALIYVLLFMIGFGYFMIAHGAKKLTKIEELN